MCSHYSQIFGLLWSLIILYFFALLVLRDVKLLSFLLLLFLCGPLEG